LDDAVYAAAGEHGAALDVDGADGVGEEHHAEDEPGGGLADGLFADAADVIDGAGHVIEDNGGGAPEADEGEGDAADQHQVDLALLPVGRQVDYVELGGLGGFNGGHGG